MSTEALSKIGKQMDRRHMDPADLMVAMKKAGFSVSWGTALNWQRGNTKPQAAALPYLARALNCHPKDLV